MLRVHFDSKVVRNQSELGGATRGCSLAGAQRALGASAAAQVRDASAAPGAAAVDVGAGETGR